MCRVWLTTNTVPGILFSHCVGGRVGGGVHSNLIIYERYVIFFEQVGVGGGERPPWNDIWSLCGASLFNLRNQRPPVRYTSDVVRKGRSADLARTHIWDPSPLPPRPSPLPPRPCWQPVASPPALWSAPALATHRARTDNVYHPVLLLTATLSLFQPGSLAPFPSGRRD